MLSLLLVRDALGLGERPHLALGDNVLGLVGPYGILQHLEAGLHGLDDLAAGLVLTRQVGLINLQIDCRDQSAVGRDPVTNAKLDQITRNQLAGQSCALSIITIKSTNEIKKGRTGQNEKIGDANKVSGSQKKKKKSSIGYFFLLPVKQKINKGEHRVEGDE